MSMEQIYLYHPNVPRNLGTESYKLTLVELLPKFQDPKKHGQFLQADFVDNNIKNSYDGKSHDSSKVSDCTCSLCCIGLC